MGAGAGIITLLIISPTSAALLTTHLTQGLTGKSQFNIEGLFIEGRLVQIKTPTKTNTGNGSLRSNIIYFGGHYR